MKTTFEEEMRWLLENAPINYKNQERNPQSIRALYNPKDGMRTFIIDIIYVIMKENDETPEWQRKCVESKEEVEEMLQKGWKPVDICLRAYREEKNYVFDYNQKRSVAEGTKLRKDTYYKISDIENEKFSFGMRMETDDYFQPTKIDTIRRKIKKESRG